MSASAAHAYKWITNESQNNKKQLKINNINNEVFSTVKNTNINLIAIFGRARQGKSFLMNCLTGETDVFKISNAKESCTQGIDISNKWLSVKEFASIDSNTKSTTSAPSIRIGFVDAEGQGDKDVTYDARLVCPILLASKVVIFNWKGDLQKDEIIERLGVMAKAASNVNNDSIHKTFGHLHIIFRDWQSVGDESTNADVYNVLFTVEKSSGSDSRDHIRRELLKSFQSIQVWLFQAPTALVSDLSKKLSIGMTTPGFRSQVRELRQVLTEQLSTPMKFGSSNLTGKHMCSLMQSIADSLNNGSIVLPQAAYVNMIRCEVDKLRDKTYEEMEGSITDILESIGKKKYHISIDSHTFFPTEVNVMKIAVSALDALMKEFLSEIADSVGLLEGDSLVIALGDCKDKMKASMATLLNHFKSQYHTLFTKYLTALQKQVGNDLEAELSSIDGKGYTNERDVTIDIQKLINRTNSRLGKSLYSDSDQVNQVIHAFERLANSKKETIIQSIQSSKQRALLIENAKGEMLKEVQVQFDALKHSCVHGFTRTQLCKVLDGRYKHHQDTLLKQLCIADKRKYKEIVDHFTEYALTKCLPVATSLYDQYVVRCCSEVYDTIIDEATAAISVNKKSYSKDVAACGAIISMQEALRVQSVCEHVDKYTSHLSNFEIIDATQSATMYATLKAKIATHINAVYDEYIADVLSWKVQCEYNAEKERTSQAIIQLQQKEREIQEREQLLRQEISRKDAEVSHLKRESVQQQQLMEAKLKQEQDKRLAAEDALRQIDIQQKYETFMQDQQEQQVHHDYSSSSSSSVRLDENNDTDDQNRMAVEEPAAVAKCKAKGKASRKSQVLEEQVAAANKWSVDLDSTKKNKRKLEDVDVPAAVGMTKEEHRRRIRDEAAAIEAARESTAIEARSSTSTAKSSSKRKGKK